MDIFLKLAHMQDRINAWYEKQAQKKRTTKDPAGERQGRVAAHQKRQEEAEKRRMQESRKYHTKRPSISKDKPKKIVECQDPKTKKWGPCAPASSKKKIVPAPQKKKKKADGPNLDYLKGMY